MKFWTLFAVCVGSCAVWPAQTLAEGDEEFPYVAYVQSPETPVRSGPGKVHYASSFLQAGRPIEVWRHDPGGWLAVRPPSGSVSWVAAEQVETTDEEGIGRIVVDEATAWVGSTEDVVGDLLWQVRLRRGELVELKSEPTSVTGQGLWYQVAPPAGEFRWIHKQFVSSSPPLPTVKSTGVVQATVTEADASASQAELVGSLQELTRQAHAAIDAAETALENGSQVSFDAAIRATEVELSLMLSRPIETWRFDELQLVATQLTGQAASDLQRGQARILLDKIERFRTLQAQLTTEVIQTPASVVPVAAAQPTEPTDTEARRPQGLRGDVDPRYDGFGWLVEVRSNRPDAPPFALVDNDGQVLTYVSPSPGRNLHRHLRKEVGVYGIQGFSPALRAPYLTAERVVELDRHRE